MTGSSLLSGLYEYDEAKQSLLQTVTGQRLTLISHDQELNIFHFEYTDKETSVRFCGQRTQAPSAHAHLLQLKLRTLKSKPLAFGLWRRLTFFVFDALPVWFFLNKQGDHLWRMESLGAWVNGQWSEGAFIRLYIRNSVSTNPHGEAINPLRDKTQVLFPLDAQPVPWLYHNGDGYSKTVRLKGEEISTDPPVMRISPSIEEQLLGIPYFYRADKQAFLFMRGLQIHFHRGEDYDPTPYYTYVREGCMFDIRAFSSYGVDTWDNWTFCDTLTDKLLWPINREGERVTGKRFHTSSVPIPIKEELFFALNDINSIQIPYEDCPLIFEDVEESSYYSPRILEKVPPSQKGLHFGSYLHELDGLPISTNMGMMSITFHGGGNAARSQRYAITYAQRKKHIRRGELTAASRIFGKIFRLFFIWCLLPGLIIMALLFFLAPH